ncbi:LLM class flavin-dependent oxidoreductase [Oligella urethralis]|uniref:LLM class flavin-dependent oxidoreductase n=1 Tax=Oligella urethralis TaxID=90245 RepID=UPI00288A6059|nr:LLM class flavin-dependent oxidoreductase [Oligella urethralis]
MQAYSVLDFSTIIEGEGASEALAKSLQLAQAAEANGYHRFWMAEHHNFPAIASSATAVALAYIGAGTQSIRIGAGGVMLPNHSPLVIAEQYGTLDALYPGRMDLGLGRAPGTDQTTARAMRRDLRAAAESFPQDIQELQMYLGEPQAGQQVQAFPGQNSQVQPWVLGSSLYGAQLAAYLGLPYSFASHFAPAMLHDAFRVYRQQFKASKAVAEPYAMPAVNMVVAETDEEAKYWFSSHQQSVLALFRNQSQKLQAPIEDYEASLNVSERHAVDSHLRYSFVGSEATVAAQLEQFLNDVPTDELMVHARIFDIDARLESLQRSAKVLAQFLTSSPA